MTQISDRQNSSSVLSWLIQASQIYWLDEAHLPTSDAILLTDAKQTHLLSAIAHSPKNHIIGIPLGSESVTALEAALRHARSRKVPLVPIGLAIAPTMKLPFTNTLPLPRAKIVIGVEVPFQVPDHPNEIPTAWVDAISTLLKRACGRAFDMLATMKRHPSR